MTSNGSDTALFSAVVRGIKSEEMTNNWALVSFMRSATDGIAVPLAIATKGVPSRFAAISHINAFGSFGIMMASLDLALARSSSFKHTAAHIESKNNENEVYAFGGMPTRSCKNAVLEPLECKIPQSSSLNAAFV